MDKQKALTVKHPWAYLICAGIKDVENRTWPTKYRGRIYIHAGAKADTGYMYTEDQWLKLCELGYKPHYMSGYLKYSAIIGHVDVVDCVQNHDSIWAEKDCYHWVLANPVLYKEPILKVRGALSLWDCSIYLKSSN